MLTRNEWILDCGEEMVERDKDKDGRYDPAGASSCRAVCIWKYEAALLPHQASVFQIVVLYFPHIFATAYRQRNQHTDITGPAIQLQNQQCNLNMCHFREFLIPSHAAEQVPQ